MKRMKAIIVIGMFVMVGCGTVAMGEPDDPVTPNQAPNAPIIIADKSSMEKQEYRCFFYAIDPDGDEVYYDLTWKKVDNNDVIACGPDVPVFPWLGPFNSGEEVNKIFDCCETGDYELTICVKDEFDNEGPSTTVTVSYTKAKEIDLNETSYNFGFIIVETFSTKGDISGIPDYDHVGGLQYVDITTNGGSISLIFTSPVWGSSINYKYNDIHIYMDQFLGVTSFSSYGGCLVGICKNISWELLD